VDRSDLMKVAIILGPQRIKIVDVKTPKITSNDVLIKIKATGICGSDLHFYSGMNGRLQNFLLGIKRVLSPSKIIRGHEFSGFVVEKGKNVDDIDLNDKVTALPISPCQECNYCKIGFTHLCESPNPWPGAFAEFIKLSSNDIVNVPEEISYEEAAMLEPLACAVHAVKISEVKKEDSVIILGAGTIGLLTLQILKSLNVEKIAITDILDFKLQMAKQLGADIAIKAFDVNYYKNRDLIKNTNLIFECVGSFAPTLHQAINLIDKHGRIIVLGSFSTPQKIDILKIRQKEVTIVGSEASNKEDFMDSIKLLSDKKVKLEPLITHKFPLKDISKAFKTALECEQTKSIKVEIIP